MIRHFLGIVLLSAATLMLELTLLRLFAVQQFYHFAFMAISLALLGYGASGSLLSVWRRRFSPTLLSFLFALTTVGAFFIINYLPFDSFSIAWDRRQILYLALYFLAAAAPFLFNGLVVGGELIAAGQIGGGLSHRVYGASLIGSGVGCVAALPALDLLGAERALVLSAMMGVGAGLLFIPAPTLVPRTSNLWFLAHLCFLLLGTAALLWPPAFLAQQLSPYKTLSVLRQMLDAEHVLTEWDATARVDVVESPSIHIMPGLSLLSPVGPPPQVGVTLDGDNLMPVTGLAHDTEAAALLADHMPAGLAYRLRPGARTLVLGAGTGLDVLLALGAGAEQVTAVEEHAHVIEVVRDRYEEFTGGLYNNPRVTVVNQAGRVFARQAPPGSYGVVTVALTDPHRPVTSGAYSLTENYVYTVEAFDDYLRALDEDGVLVVTRWLQTPPSECARTFGTLAAALAARGQEPAEHLIAFRTLRTITVLATRHPVTGEQIEIVREFLRARGYDAVYFPGVQPDETNRYSVLADPVYADLFAAILADPVATYVDYRFEIRPPTDDRPFFFHYFKWRQTPEILAAFGLTWQPFGGSGFFVLIALLLLVTLASALFIVAPLLVQRGLRMPSAGGASGERPISRRRVFLYYACLGLAFLFVEIPLAQYFILVLAQPVVALSVVLFAILLFSGLGSITVRRWRLEWALIALVILIGVYLLVLAPLSTFALWLPEWLRILFIIAMLAPLGYLMGIPFAGGLRVVEARSPALVPWAWAINGSTSVISAVLAIIFALSWGLTTVIWLGAAAYACAFLAFWRQ
jgi:hypothetical protein